MKILFVTSSYPLHERDPLPAGNFVHRLAVELMRKGHEVVVIAPHVKGVPEHYFLEDVEIYRVRYSPERLEKLSNVPGGLPQLIARKSPYLLTLPFMMGAFSIKIAQLIGEVDLIHVHWIFNAFPLLPLRFSLKKPVVVTVHGSDARILSKLPFPGLIRRLADQYVTVNRSQIEILEGLGVENVKFIPNGVEDNYSPLPPLPPVVIGTVGHFVEVKNFPTLAKALRILYEEGLDFRAVFMGDGDHRQQIEAIVHDFSDRVEITGYIPNYKVLRKLRDMHIFVLPSFSEGRSIALLEAMASGRAIVASDIPQNRELIRDGKNGLLFDPYSPQELADRLRRLLNDRELLIKLAKRSYNTIREQGLMWSETAGKYIEVYEQLLKGGG